MNEEIFKELEEKGAEVSDTLKRLMGDKEFYMDYLSKLPENENIINLRAAVMAGDCETAMKEVHTLKGVALNLGLQPMVDVCMDMLLDFRDGSNEEAMEQLEDVEAAFNEWAAIIKKYRQNSNEGSRHIVHGGEINE